MRTQSKHDPPARLLLTEVYVNPTARVLPSPRSLHSTPEPGGGCFDPAQTNLIAHRMRQVCLPAKQTLVPVVPVGDLSVVTCGNVQTVGDGLSVWTALSGECRDVSYRIPDALDP